MVSGGIAGRGTMAVLWRYLVLYRRLWRASVFSSLVLPVLFVVSFGVGVGAYVGDVDGVDYLAWIVPGILASTAFQIAISETTYPVLGDFRWVRAYYGIAATPVVPGDIVAGMLLFLLVRVGVSSAAFLAVAAAFGALRSWWALAAVLVCALTALAVAGATAAFSARLDNDGYFALLTRLVVIPATLFAGVFFPVEQLPAVVRPVAYALPLWHGVELDRSATLGVMPPWPVAAHVAYLVVWALAGAALAVRSFDRRLRD